MKNAILYIISLLLAMSGINATAQEGDAEGRISRNPLDNLIVRSEVKQSLFPEERVYLHFDNSAYYLGEDMWFKAYVMSGENDAPTTMSRVLYVELVAPEGYVVKTNKYKIDEEGTCNGTFELNELLLSGYYEVRAYTRYMLNRGKESIFSRVFPVFDKVHADNWDFKNMLDRRRGFLVDIEQDDSKHGLEREVEWINAQLPVADVMFFPEGGHLVNGLESRVAFEVFGADGINSNRNITILADGKELLTATPTHLGKGSFTITPDEDVRYTAILMDGKRKRRFNLPDVEEEGAVINVEQSAGSIIVNIKNNLELDTEVGCAILHRGKTRFYERYNSSDREMTFAVDMNSLNEGVNRVVLFIGEGIPLAERMFFVTHDKAISGDRESVRLTVTGNGHNVDSLRVNPYEKITLSIGREDGKPIEDGNFSLSVSDADNRQETSYSYNIYTYMLLGSELKGYIPNASRYFDPENADRNSELDLVMLTHGWTSYDWSKLCHKEAKLEQPIEKGITIKGRYIKKVPNRKFGHLDEMIVTNLPDRKIDLNISYRDSLFTKYDFRTDANGEFRLLTEDFTGKRVAQLVPRNKGFIFPQDSMYTFVLDRYFSPEMRLYHYWERNVGNAMTAEDMKQHRDEMIKINPFEYLLSNVEVISKRKKDPFYRPPRSEMRFDYLDEWEYAMDVTYLHRRASWSSMDFGEDLSGYNPVLTDPSYYETKEPTYTPLERWNRITNVNQFGPDYSGQVYANYNDLSNYSSIVNRPPMIDPSYNTSLSAYQVLRSAFWRHNLNWCYWIQSIVVDGEYSSDTIPAIDTEYLKGVDPVKMTNFNEIVIRSDENTRKQHELWENSRSRRAKTIGNFRYSSFYASFIYKSGIAPRSGDIDDAPDAIQYQTYVDGGLHMMSSNSIPNYVACFIPNKEDAAANGIVPQLARNDNSRYTLVYGYTGNKEFYAPDYSTMRPGSTMGDYRRTLLWMPDVKAADDGKIEVELYNSTQARRLAVEIEGYANGTFYGNNGNITTREAEDNTFADIKRQLVAPIIGIHTPDLLAHCYILTENGRMLYIQNEYEKAFEQFSEAAALGYSDAIYNAGVCYLNGTGIAKDSIEAFKHFRKAANLGQEKALHNLASCYLYGIGTTRNDSLALHYYTMSANNGNATSQATLGHIYMNGDIVEQDSIKGREWFEKAIEKEEPTSLLAVANILEQEDSIAGYGKRKLRKSQAVRYLMKAAEKNHPMAQYKLASYYENGKYVKKSKKEAFRWYKEAAEHGHPQAMERVGYCYEKGRGVKKNEPLAAHWYSLAEQNGQEFARKRMEWYNIFHFFEE